MSEPDLDFNGGEIFAVEGWRATHEGGDAVIFYGPEGIVEGWAYIQPNDEMKSGGIIASSSYDGRSESNTDFIPLAFLAEVIRLIDEGGNFAARAAVKVALACAKTTDEYPMNARGW